MAVLLKMVAVVQSYFPWGCVARGKVFFSISSIPAKAGMTSSGIKFKLKLKCKFQILNEVQVQVQESSSNIVGCMHLNSALNFGQTCAGHLH